MKRPPKLSESDIKASLSEPELAGWDLVDGKLHKSFQFRDFVEAWGFMSRSALAAEKLDHHPNWLNVYNAVHVDLNTHDVGGVTVLDLALARIMNALVS